MADASLALAERRADDLKHAAERLGVDAPTGRQLRGLRFMGLVAPPASAGRFARVRGVLIILGLIVGVLLARFRHRQPDRAARSAASRSTSRSSTAWPWWSS